MFCIYCGYAYELFNVSKLESGRNDGVLDDKDAYNFMYANNPSRSAGYNPSFDT